jgi:predicted ATPase with chaperone activity
VKDKSPGPSQGRYNLLLPGRRVAPSPIRCNFRGFAHNLLLTGPPGAGKTMLARRLPGLLPPLEQDEALEVTQVFSAAGLLGPGAGLIGVRPFRAPHHAISVPGLVGGGRLPRPGEVSLANLNVLSLDDWRVEVMLP